MSMQITVDPSGLTTQQREAVAGFILAFPGACAGTCHKEPTAPAVIAAISSEPARLQAEAGDPVRPSDAFKVDEAAAAFPLVQAAPAPSFAGAALPSTVPVVPPLTSTGPATAPPPPAAPTAPVAGAPTALAAPLNPAVVVDKQGLPWDSRIHAGSKVFIADGTWRKKKQLDPALLVSVEAELRQLMAAAPVVSTLSTTPWPAGLDNAAPLAQAPIPAPGVGVAPMPPTSGAASSGATAPASASPSGDPRAAYVALIGRTSAAIQAGKVSNDEITAICAPHGVPSLPLLVSRLDLVDTIAAGVDFLIASKG